MPRRDQDGLEYMFKDAATESLWDDEPEGGGGASPFPDSPLGREACVTRPFPVL
jgi:hypothetical protein